MERHRIETPEEADRGWSPQAVMADMQKLEEGVRLLKENLEKPGLDEDMLARLQALLVQAERRLGWMAHSGYTTPKQDALKGLELNKVSELLNRKDDMAKCSIDSKASLFRLDESRRSGQATPSSCASSCAFCRVNMSPNK